MTPRRMVRCERCGNEWVAVQEVEAAPDAIEPVDIAQEPVALEHDMASPPATASVPAMERLTPSRPSTERNVGLLAAWIASVLVLAGAATALLVWRSDVVRAWPPSARLLGSPAIVAMPAHAPASAAARTAEKPAPHE